MSGTVRRTPQSLPVHVLTGFLGAGKTTLLNRFVSTAYLSEAALVINEFGAVGIDHLLVENSSDGVIELADGCICCTVRGELVDTLADLMDRLQTGRIRRFGRVVVETTGLADPVPVIQAVIGHPVLAQTYRFGGLITVVDAVNGAATLENHEEARRQVALADRLVVSKGALADIAQRQALETRLAALNQRVAILDGDDEALSPEAVFECGAYDPQTRLLTAEAWLGTEQDCDHAHHNHGGDPHHHHDESIRSESLVIEEAIAPQALAMFLDLLRSAHGPKLLRMKGIVKLADDPDRPAVIHAVQSVVAEPVRLPHWPAEAEGRSRIVVITRDMPPGFIGELFAAFADQPGIGRPDREALVNNPLAIPGSGRL